MISGPWRKTALHTSLELLICKALLLTEGSVSQNEQRHIHIIAECGHALQSKCQSSADIFIKRISRLPRVTLEN